MQTTQSNALSIGVISEVKDYAGLVHALRERVESLNITRIQIDELGQLPDGHASKLLAPIPTKGFGVKSLGRVLGALGVKLLVVDDPDARARIEPLIEPRNRERVHLNNTSRRDGMKPIYRALETHSSLGLAPYAAGAEVQWDGWPKASFGKFEPANEPARRVWTFWQENRQCFGFPDTPRDQETGRFFLPAHLMDPRSTQLPSLPKDVPENAPIYKARWQQKFGQQLVEIGQHVALLAWPFMGGLEPINEPAKQVVTYFEQHRGNPRLRAAPYDLYSRSLWLPELPAMPRQTYARDISQDRDPWHDQITRERVAEAQRTLRAATGSQNRKRGSRPRVGA